MLNKAILTLALFSALAYGGTAYPNGTFSTGKIVGVMPFEQGYVRFVLSGTMGNGQPGGENFWIDLGKSGASAQMSTVLTAFSTGVNVRIWHYGTEFSYGGQSGYTQGFIYMTKN